MIATSEIRQWPLNEKLALMETFWRELSADPAQIEVPPWHLTLLDERLAAHERGSAKVEDWEVAKDQIRALRQ